MKDYLYATLGGLVIAAFLAACAFALVEDIKHPCIKTTTVTHHEAADTTGTALWLTTGHVSYIALNHPERDVSEEVCIERK